MRINVSGASDIVLDWMVATAQGAVSVPQSGGPTWLVDGAMLGYVSSYNPSSDWEYGGPIIERECISLDFASKLEWEARLYVPDEEPWLFTGPTPLIAAMRCYVASKLGAEIDVPEKLLS